MRRPSDAIGAGLGLTQWAVQKDASPILHKLGLPASESDDRRILAVLAYPLAEPHR